MKISTFVVVLCFLIAGCTNMHVVCPESGTVTESVGGNTAGQQILTSGLAMAGTAATGAKFMGVKAPNGNSTPTPTTQSTIDHNYLPWFGPDYASCSALPPAQPPSTSIVFVHADGTTTTVTSDSHQVVVPPPMKVTNQ